MRRSLNKCISLLFTSGRHHRDERAIDAKLSHAFLVLKLHYQFQLSQNIGLQEIGLPNLKDW